MTAGENRMLMSVLIGSDSRSLSRLCVWGLFVFLGFFLLLIVAQEGAVILF